MNNLLENEQLLALVLIVMGVLVLFLWMVSQLRRSKIE